jgi:hypothetical protein
MEQPATIDPLASPEKERRFGRAIRSGARLAAANWLGDATVLNVGMFLSRPDLSEYSCADPIKKMRAICDSLGKLMR